MAVSQVSAINGGSVNLLVGIKATATRIMQVNITSSKLTILVKEGVGLIGYSIPNRYNEQYKIKFATEVVNELTKK